MRNVLTYSGPDDKPGLLELIWPSQDMKFHPIELRSSLEYYYRMKRGKDEVESEIIEHAKKLKVLVATPGHYYSDGVKLYRRD